MVTYIRGNHHFEVKEFHRYKVCEIEMSILAFLAHEYTVQYSTERYSSRRKKRKHAHLARLYSE